jgi:hypothetical protein
MNSDPKSIMLHNGPHSHGTKVVTFAKTAAFGRFPSPKACATWAAYDVLCKTNDMENNPYNY